MMNSEFSYNDLFRQFEMELKADISDSHLDYGPIEQQLFDKIEAAEEDGVLSLLRIDEIPPNAVMESIEETVAKRIHEHSEYEEPVDECIKTESDLPTMYWRHFYRGLERRMDPVSELSPFEQALKIEEIMPEGRWEKVEDSLFERIAKYESGQAQNRLAFGFFWGMVREQYKRVGALALVLGAALGIWQGGLFYQNNYRPITCRLYQVQGPNIDVIKSTMPLTGPLCSEAGGSMTMINKYGYVELQNGSRLEILTASEKKVHYKAGFAGADKQLVGQGSITFFVNKQKGNEKFIVSTGDYRIEVVGTYFKLQPDLKGHVAISVKEGQVKVIFSNGDVKILNAGQNMGYDMNYNSYYSTSDGTIVPRQEIEQFPDVHDLGEYQQIYITTSVPNAGVRIDGRYVGMSPIIILEPRGLHSISIEKNGYIQRDTTIMLGSGQPNMYAIGLKEIKAVTVQEGAAVAPETIEKPAPKAVVRPSISKAAAPALAPVPDDSAKGYFQKAELSEASNWREALALYEKVFNNHYAPHLEREAAYFSIAKLLEDHSADKTRAKEGFFNYLALYPTGSFVGESWLRLAELEFSHDQDKAVEYYLKYFDKYPRHYRIAELQERVGLIYLQKKKYDNALGMFKLALSNIQGDDQVNKSKILANIYKTLKEKESARQADILGADNSSNTGQKP
jgi:Fe2+-dicitrate sensor, membrane component